MLVRVNGLNYDVKEGIKLLQLLADLKYNCEGVVIEYNEEIISNDKWEQIRLKAEDKLEIVAFVGGG